MKPGLPVTRMLFSGLLIAFAATAGLEAGHAQRAASPSAGPADQGTPAPRQDGNATAGRDVFRFETFGNEGFWTDAVRVPAGVAAAKVTPMMAMKLGVSVDVDALDAETLKALVAELERIRAAGRRSCSTTRPRRPS